MEQHKKAKFMEEFRRVLSASPLGGVVSRCRSSPRGLALAKVALWCWTRVVWALSPHHPELFLHSFDKLPLPRSAAAAAASWPARARGCRPSLARARGLHLRTRREVPCSWLSQEGRLFLPPGEPEGEWPSESEHECGLDKPEPELRGRREAPPPPPPPVHLASGTGTWGGRLQLQEARDSRPSANTD